MSLFRSLLAQAKEISLKNEILSGTQNLKLMAAVESSKMTSTGEVDHAKMAPISK